jgi:hypothetical protein
MLGKSLVAAIAVTAALWMAVDAAAAFDDAKYPNLKGQWVRARIPVPGGGQAPFDPTKGTGLRQQAPLTPEYQKIFEANLAEQAQGLQGNWQGGRCLPVGMPGVMNLYRPMEIVITPEVTYIMIDHLRGTVRRVYTDGRKWPDLIDPSFDGYSIGQWLDTDNDGKFDTLQIETRALRLPRAYDPSGLPFHADGETVVKERIYPDKTKADTIYNEMTVFDNALTRPWSVKKTYTREPVAHWVEDVCTDGQALITVGKDEYFVSGDGFLMPIRKDQPPPNLKYWNKPSN